VIDDFDAFLPRLAEAQSVRKAQAAARGTPEGTALFEQIKRQRRAAAQANLRWLGQTLLRQAYSGTAFRERLTGFWADHFTAHGKAGVIRRGTAPYVESAIRPRIAGRFADLLIAAVTHPVMLDYLDQRMSMGPNSVRAGKRDGTAGLNENLAREVLELHTLGVGAPYDQGDVRQLAMLFTGLSFSHETGFRFRPDFAEPGAETVLGVRYGPEPGLGPIHAALEDLAARPETAAHIARKLATHFVSDTPDPGLVAHLAARYLATDGDLLAVYGALLEHPGAWDRAAPNVKWPLDYMGSALRALAVPPEMVTGLDAGQVRGLFYGPLRFMGQHWQEPPGPDGWPEADGNWITPQSLSVRIRWAITAPGQLMPELPDPRRFAETALGARLTPAVRFAAEAAESKAEAIALVLASPAFQRR
jgi:uncharacterized protein (DUF1800 family)